jgi:outer membrane biosynthesis protein TonB
MASKRYCLKGGFMHIPAVFFASAVLLASLTVLAQSAPAGSPNPAPASAETDKPKPKSDTGGVEILSDTQGVGFSKWLARWHRITERTWDPLIPDEVNSPKSKSGQLVIRFKVLPNGRLMAGSMVLEGRSGDAALDRAAWGAITGSNYPPLPTEFHGPFLELRALFVYNMKPQR